MPPVATGLLCMCYRGLARFRTTFRRNEYEKDDDVKLADLSHNEVNGVLLNLLARVTGSVFFCAQLRIDEPSKGPRYYIAIKRKREEIWVEYIHWVPFSPRTVIYVWEPEQTVGTLNMRVIITN